MNKGHHWEWRVFGKLPPEERQRIESFCYDLDLMAEKTVEDKYLWCDGCRANIKIRKKKLKFKHRLHTTADGCQLWSEEEVKSYRFPLPPMVIEQLEKELQSSAPPAIRTGGITWPMLREALPRFSLPLRVISVDKHRRRYILRHRGISFHLEITEVLFPLRLLTICLEGENFSTDQTKPFLTHLRRAKNLLNVPDTMQVMGYVELLDRLDRCARSDINN